MQRKPVAHCRKKFQPKPLCSPSPSPPCPRDSPPDSEVQCQTCIIQLAPIPVAQRCPPDSIETHDCQSCVVLIDCEPTQADLDIAFGRATATGCTLTSRDSTITVVDCYNQQTRIWTARNKSGQRQVVCRTVRWPTNTTPRVVTAYEDKTVACARLENLEFDEPEFEDDCDDALTITEEDVRNPDEDCTYFINGTYTATRTWTATNACGNSASVSQTITVGPCIPTLTCANFDDTVTDCTFVPQPTDFPLLTAGQVSGFADPFEDLIITGFNIITKARGDNSTLYSRTLIVQDSCGNVEECIQTIKVPDCPVGQPFIVCPDPPPLDECGVVPTDDDFVYPVDGDLRNFPRGTTIQGLVANNQLYFTGPFPKEGDGFTDYTRITVIVFNGQNITCEQTIRVLDCPPEQRGCSRSFWQEGFGLTQWDQVMLNVPELNPLPIPPKLPLRFDQDTNFRLYFGLPATYLDPELVFPNIPLGADMLDLLFLSNSVGGFCWSLLSNGVTALLNAAAFPDSYDFPVGTTDFASLYTLIAATLEADKNTDCRNLDEQLAVANDITDDITCQALLTPNFACGNDFWFQNQHLWNSLNDPTVDAMPFQDSRFDLRFVPSTNFWFYFRFLQPLPGFSASLTMAGALQIIRSAPCSNLMGEAVVALLNAAAFPTTYQYPPGSTDFASLYNLILVTLSNRTEADCTALLNDLRSANSQDTSQCPNIENVAASTIRVTCSGDKTIDCGQSPSGQFNAPTNISTNCTTPDDTVFVQMAEIRTPAERLNPDGTYSLTRIWTYTDRCGGIISCSQTITIAACPAVTQKGCSRDFYSDQGATLWNQQNDDLVVTINRELFEVIPFAQDRSLLGYFGFSENTCAISTTVTLLGIFSVPAEGNECIRLAAEGVAALLNMATFGSEYIIPSSCKTSVGSKINTLFALYKTIQDALLACDPAGCAALANCLASANNNEGPLGIYCPLPPVENFACDRDFWLNNQQLWNSLNDSTVAAMPSDSFQFGDLRFVPSINFWVYFNPLQPFGDLPADLTMADAVQFNGGSVCEDLVRDGVISLLNAAAFPTTYDYPTGATDFTSLYNLILTTLSNRTDAGCTSLLAELQIANIQDQSRCPNIESGATPTITITCGVDKRIECGQNPRNFFDGPGISNLCGGNTSLEIATPDIRVPFTGTDPTTGEYSLTRVWTIGDDCGGRVSCSQTITVKACPEPVSFSGCPGGFWRLDDFGNEGPRKWNSLTDAVVLAMPPLLQFTTNTNFWNYFGNLTPFGGLLTTMTMLEALFVPGDDQITCLYLVAPAVGALLNAATFPAVLPGTYRYPVGATNFTTLRTLIINTFNGTSNISCLQLALFLSGSNSIDQNAKCNQLSSGFGFRKGIKAQPKKVIKKQVAPSKKAVVPVNKKPARRTFIPRNA